MDTAYLSALAALAGTAVSPQPNKTFSELRESTHCGAFPNPAERSYKDWHPCDGGSRLNSEHQTSTCIVETDLQPC
jgi:hypothetical protein